MKPPKMVYVGATDVPVRIKKRMPDAVGEFSEVATDITLLSGQSESGLRDTLAHECLHAIFYIAGIRKSLSLTYEDEERLVVTLAPWLLAVLRDNPKLVEFLLENRDREY